MRNIIDKILYRSWQFYKAVFPRLNLNKWKEITEETDDRLKPLLEKLGKAEKAHTLRVFSLISKDNRLTKEQQRELSDFAIVHDIGKAITKPSLFFKVAKVILRLSSDAHCIEGCRAVWKLTRNKKLALRILRHHVKPNSDEFLAKFQQYDDQA